MTTTIKGGCFQLGINGALSNSNFEVTSALNSRKYTNDDLMQRRLSGITSKHEQLYEDAKFREHRKNDVYANLVPKSCTFQPNLITKTSKVSKRNVRDARDDMR